MSNLHTHCPRCRQPLPYSLRDGVYLPPRKAEIYDIIEANPGITIEDIIPRLSGPAITVNAIRVHVHQINDMLASTDIRIRSGDIRVRISGDNGAGRRGYYYIKRTRAAA